MTTETMTSEDVSAQLKRITDHLGFLEKKLDTLLEQTRQNRQSFKPAFGNRDYQGQGQNRGYRPQRAGTYPPRHTGQPSHSAHGPANRYQGQSQYPKKYTPHRGNRQA